MHCISHLGAYRINLALLILLLAACSRETQNQNHAGNQTTPSTQPITQDSPEFWKSLTSPLHGKQIANEGSFAVIVPRDDIDLESEMGQIPTSAGIESRFYFWRCECGKVKVMGEFLAADYESDDVIDALRGGRFTIDSISPILQNTRPNLVAIRFQSEGDGEDLVQTLKTALAKIAPHHSTTNPDD
jgi:uncharacterized protein DUF1259